jgi:hypothetical protein
MHDIHQHADKYSERLQAADCTQSINYSECCLQAICLGRELGAEHAASKQQADITLGSCQLRSTCQPDNLIVNTILACNVNIILGCKHLPARSVCNKQGQLPTVACAVVLWILTT